MEDADEEISIHAPRTGSDKERELGAPVPLKFQSTLPARGATWLDYQADDYPADFNPRSPHGERRQHDADGQPRENFNPRSPHGERHMQSWLPCCCCGYFNPRSPHGERRAAHQWRTDADGISIHAPRTGSDVSYSAHSFAISIFQSTLPARGATIAIRSGTRTHGISIHAPRTGSDSTTRSASRPRKGISIHAPRTGSDVSVDRVVGSRDYFNPRSPHGERRHCGVGRC